MIWPKAEMEVCYKTHSSLPWLPFSEIICNILSQLKYGVTQVFFSIDYSPKRAISFLKLPVGKNHDVYTLSVFLTPEFLGIFITVWVSNKASLGYPVFLKIVIVMWDSWLISSFYLETRPSTVYRCQCPYSRDLTCSCLYSFISPSSRQLSSMFRCSSLWSIRC